MIQYRKKFKEISLDEYKKGIKGMSEFEILFSPYHKELNFSKLVPINGKGLLDYIHREKLEELSKNCESKQIELSWEKKIEKALYLYKKLLPIK